MYVCVCNAITERQLQKAINNGACSMRQLETELNIASNCGSCREVIDEHLDRTISTQLGNVVCSAG